MYQKWKVNDVYQNARISGMYASINSIIKYDGYGTDLNITWWLLDTNGKFKKLHTEDAYIPNEDYDEWILLGDFSPKENA